MRGIRSTHQVHGPCREGDVRARLPHDPHDPEERLLPKVAELVEIDRPEPALDFDVERGGGEGREPRHHDVRPDLRVRAERRLDAGDHAPHLLLGRPVDEAHRGREADPVAGGEVLDPHVGELAVREADERPVERADLGRAHADALDVAGEVLDLHEVAHPEGLVGRQGDRAEQVLDRLLRAEGEGEAADAEAGEDGRHRVAEGGEGGHDASDPDQQLDEVAGDGEERPGGGTLGRPGPLHQELGPHVDRAPEGPEDGDRGGPAEERPDGAVSLGQQPEPGQQDGGHHHRPQEGEGGRGPLQQALVPLGRGAHGDPVEERPW